MQTSLFPIAAPVPETLIRNQVMQSMEERRALELERLRKWARHAGYKNDKGQKYNIIHGVTTDDVRTLAGIKKQTRTHQDPRAGINNIMGHVFRTKYFENSGEKHISEAEGGHGNPITIWIFKPEIWKEMKPREIS